MSSTGAATLGQSAQQGEVEVKAPAVSAVFESADPYGARDIVAQESMADASIAMAIAAFLTFSVTALGTYLIREQIKLTRLAVQDTCHATKAMERQNILTEEAQRPWVTAELQPLYVGSFGKKLAIEIDAHFTNLGATPGVCVAACVDVLFPLKDFPTELSNWIKSVEASLPEAAKGKILPKEKLIRSYDKTIRHKDIPQTDEKDAPKNLVFIIVVAAIFYKRNEEDEEWLKTIRPYILKKRQNTRGRSDAGFNMAAFPLEDCDITAEKLNVESVRGEETK